MQPDLRSRVQELTWVSVCVQGWDMQRAVSLVRVWSCVNAAGSTVCLFVSVGDACDVKLWLFAKSVTLQVWG